MTQLKFSPMNGWSRLASSCHSIQHTRYASKQRNKQHLLLSLPHSLLEGNCIQPSLFLKLRTKSSFVSQDISSKIWTMSPYKSTKLNFIVIFLSVCYNQLDYFVLSFRPATCNPSMNGRTSMGRIKFDSKPLQTSSSDGSTGAESIKECPFSKSCPRYRIDLTRFKDILLRWIWDLFK